MTACQMNVFILCLLMIEVGAFDRKHDWTFGKSETNIAYNKPSTDPKAVDGNLATASEITGNGPQWWKTNLAAIFTVAMIRLYPKEPSAGFHEISTTRNIEIYSSLVHTPGEISGSSDDWRHILSNDIVYGYGVTADFQPPVHIRHVGVKTLENSLIIAELQVFAPINLAQLGNIQGSNTGEFELGELVDGDYRRRLFIRGDATNWIDIDLLSIYSIKMIEIFKCNDPEAKILSTKDYPFKSLSESEDGWISTPHTSVGLAGEMRFEFSTILEARRVALVSYRNSSSVGLSELVVTEYNYALSEGTTAKLTGATIGAFSTYSAKNVIDGKLNTFMSTTRIVNATWTLELGKPIFFIKALVYVRTGKCVNGDCSRRFYGKLIFAITHQGARICLPYENPLGDSFILECGNIVFHGLKIIGGTSSIGLREIVIHGKELPTTADIKLKAERIDSTSVLLTFNQWTSKSSGSKAPDKYILRNEGGGSLKKSEFKHDGGHPIQTRIIGSLRNDLVAVYVECVVDGAKCVGPPAKVYYSPLYIRQNSAFLTAFGVAAAVFYVTVAAGIIFILWKRQKGKNKVAVKLSAVGKADLQKIKTLVRMSKTHATSRPIRLSETIATPDRLGRERQNSTIEKAEENQMRGKAKASLEQKSIVTRKTLKKTDDGMLPHASIPTQNGKHSEIGESISKNEISMASYPSITDKTPKARVSIKEKITSQLDSSPKIGKTQVMDSAKASIESKAVDTSKTSRENRMMDTVKASIESKAVDTSKTSRENRMMHTVKASIESKAVDTPKTSGETRMMDTVKASIESKAVDTPKTSRESDMVGSVKANR